MTRRRIVHALTALAARPRYLTYAFLGLFFGCSTAYSIAEDKGPP